MKDTTLKLNLTNDFEISGFSRNTVVQDGKLVSSSYVTLKDPASSDIARLRGIALEPVTDLSLVSEGRTIYELSNQEAQITSIDEALNDDGTMRVSFYIRY